MVAETTSLSSWRINKQDWILAGLVAGLAVATALLWPNSSRAQQFTILVAAGILGLTYARYLEIAAFALGFLMTSGVSIFVGSSTSMLLAFTLVILVLRKLLAADFRWRLGSFVLVAALFSAYMQVTGLWAEQLNFYDWSFALRVLPTVVIVSELMGSQNAFLALFIGCSVGMIFTSVSAIKTAAEFFTTGVADQLIQTYGRLDQSRFYGHWEDPNVMCMSLTAYLGGVIALWRSRLHGIIRLVAMVAVVTCIAAILLSMSRTGLIGLVVAIGLMLAVERRRILLTSIVVAVVIVLVSVFPLELFARVTSLLSGDGSASERLDLVLSGWKLFWNNPVLGGGLGSYQNDVLYLMPFLPHGFISHNTFVDIAVDGGVVAILIFFVGLAWAYSGLNWKKWAIDPSDTASVINSGLRACLVASTSSLFTMSAMSFVPFWNVFTMCAVFSMVVTPPSHSFIPTTEPK